MATPATRKSGETASESSRGSGALPKGLEEPDQQGCEQDEQEENDEAPIPPSREESGE